MADDGVLLKEETNVGHTEVIICDDNENEASEQHEEEEEEEEIVEENGDFEELSELFEEVVDNRKFTPTGRISHAKTRVYTQRYRKEWEESPDFKGWLVAVENEPTRAYCIYCEKNLHAHRLSLLKHTCTMKHQRSALMYQAKLEREKTEKLSAQLSSESMKRNGNNEEESNNDAGDSSFPVIQIDEEDESQVNSSADDETISSDVEFIPTKRPRRIVKKKKDTLAEAMAHVHGEYLESENDDNFELIDQSSDSIIQENKLVNPKVQRKVVAYRLRTPKLSSDESQEIAKSITPLTRNKTITLTNGKIVTISGVMNRTNSRTKVKLNQIINQEVTPTTSKKPVKINSTDEKSVSKVVVSKPIPCISTQVLDTSKGLPVVGLQVSLYKLIDGKWTFLNESTTSSTGRCQDLVDLNKIQITAGRYKVHFDVDKYFTSKKIETMYPFIEVVFDVKNPTGTYNIPLLLSPFSYTVYRGVEY